LMSDRKLSRRWVAAEIIRPLERMPLKPGD